MSIESAEPMIGRGHVAVPDPLNRYRAIVGDNYAKRIDEAASRWADEVVERGDTWLARRWFELDRPLDKVDPALAAEDRALEQRFSVRTEIYHLSLEEAAVLDGRALEDPAAAELRAAAEDQRALAGTAEELIGELYDDGREPEGPSDRLRFVDEYLGSFDWVGEISESVAIARELAIREALRERPAPPAAIEGVHQGHGPDVRQIGTGGAAAILGGDEAADRRRVRPADLEDARIVTRSDVSPPRALDGLRRVLGEERVQRLAVRAEVLAETVETMPDEWLQARYAELGDPREGLDGEAAFKTLRLEGALKGAGQARGGPAGDLDLLRREQFDLDAWIASDDDRLVRAIAYADELAIRRHVEIGQQVEISVVDPPAHVTDLIGPPPGIGTPGRDEWEAITREVEVRRLLRESARREGLEPPARDPWAERDLEARVGRVREERGMEPPAEQGRERSGGEAGFETGC